MEEVPVIPGGPEPSTATTTTTGTDPILEKPTVESKGKGVKKSRKRKRGEGGGEGETSGPPFRTKVGVVIPKRVVVQDARSQSTISWLGKVPKRVLLEKGEEEETELPNSALDPLDEIADNLQCGVCYSQFSEQVEAWAPPCGHILCKPCVEGLEKAAVRLTSGNKRLACPTCRAGCEKNGFIKLTLSSKTCVASRPLIKIAEELEHIKNRLLNPTFACITAMVEEDAERLKLVPQIITSHNLAAHMPNYLTNFVTESRLVKGVTIRNNTQLALTRLDALIQDLYKRQAVTDCEGDCECEGDCVAGSSL